MPALTSIQQGTLTITEASGATVNVTISAVTTANAVVSFTHRDADDQGRELRHMINAQLTSTTNLRFTRNTEVNAKDVTVEWVVLDFAGASLNSSIQTGTVDCTNSNQNVTISAITMAQTALLFSFETDQTFLTTTPTVYLTSTTNIEIGFGAQTPGAGDCLVRWWVVEFAASTVATQQGLISLANTDNSKTAAVSAVVLATSLVDAMGMASTETAWSTSPARGRALVQFNSTTQIEAFRSIQGTLKATEVAWQILSLTDAGSVQREVRTVTNTTTSDNRTFTALTGNCGVWQGNSGQGNSWYDTDGGGLPYAINYSLNFDETGKDDVNIDRVNGTGEFDVNWAIVVWAAAAAGGATFKWWMKKQFTGGFQDLTGGFDA